MSVPTSARSVLNGRYAEASVGGVLIALLYEWEVTVDTDSADVTAHGDPWKYKVALDSGWTFRAKSYVVPASAAHIINSLYSSGAVPPNVVVAGFSGTVAGGTKIFEGTGTPKRAALAAPMELATQEFEVEGYGPPTVGV
jgi:hypothetical protein